MASDRGLLGTLVGVALGFTMFSYVGPSRSGSATSTTPSSASAAGQAGATAASGAGAGASPATTTRDPVVPDALSLLAEFLQVDISSEALERISTEEVQLPPTSTAESILRGPALVGSAREGAESPEVAMRTRLRIARALHVVQPELARAGVLVNFLVATLPDPYDSQAGWLFDSSFYGVRRGIEQAEFTLDRFYLPDWDPRQAGGGTPSGRVHEQHPGMVLFKRQRRGAQAGAYGQPTAATERHTELLLVWLVPETPVAGIHASPFLRAMRFLRDWCASRDADPALGCAETVHIIGPSFSGSARSLRLAMDHARIELHAPFRYRLWSGAATGAINVALLNDPPVDLVPRDEARIVSFRSAAIPDAVTNPEIERVLEHDFGLDRRDLVKLAETTVYGVGASRASRPATRADGDGGAPPTSRIDTYQFPLHLSRLRAVSQDAPGPRTPEGMAPVRPVRLDEPTSPTDLFPALRKEMTEASVQLMVRQQLAEIHKQRRRAIGIMATDVRDRLFLAQEIRYSAPNALLFTSESSLLYAHPSFLPFMRGMLVASTYPLSAWAQRLTSAQVADRSQPFSTSSSQGTFNATSYALRILLGDTAGRREGLQLLDYGLPMASCVTDAGQDESCDAGLPVLWLSVVGRNGLWPIKAVPVHTSEVARRFMLRERPAAVPSSVETPLLPSYPAITLYWLIVVAAALHGLVALRPHGRAATLPFLRLFTCLVADRHGDGTTSQATRREVCRARTPSLVVCVLTLLLLATIAASLAWTALVHAPATVFSDVTWFRIGAVIGGAAAWALAAAGSLRLLLALRRLPASRTIVPFSSTRADGECPEAAVERPDERPARSRAVTGWVLQPAVLRSALVAVCLGAAACYLAWLARAFAWRVPLTGRDFSDLPSVLLFDRAAHLTNGVNPMVVILCFCLGLYVVGALKLRLTVVRENARFIWELTQRLRPGTAQAPDAVRPVVEAKTQSVSRWTVVVGLTTLAVFAVAMTRVRPLTVEGRLFDFGYSAAYVAIQTIIVTGLVKIVVEWLHIRGALDSLTERQDILDAFERLPGEMRHTSRLIQRPRLRETRTFSSRAASIYAAVAPDGSSPAAARIDRCLKTIASERIASPRAPWSTSVSKLCMRDLTRDIVSRLSEPPAAAAAAAPSESTPSTAGEGPADAVVVMRAERAPDQNPLSAWQQDCVAVQLLLSLREEFSHLAQMALVVMGLIFVLIATHVLYPVHPRQLLQAIAWMNLTAAIVIGLSGLFAIDRNGVLSAMTGTTAGAISWNWTLVTRVALYALVPLISALAVQFPEAGGALLQWLEPVRRALP